VQLEDLLQTGCMKPIVTLWGASVLFVKKKDGTLKSCRDYRELNKITVKNKYPLSNIDDLFDQLWRMRVFLKIDLKSVYHPFRIKPEDIPKADVYHSLWSLQIYSIATWINQCSCSLYDFISWVFRLILDKFVFVFTDDILMYLKTEEKHTNHLTIMLQTLTKHKVHAKLSKCDFWLSEVNFLGHVISKDAIKGDPQKEKAVTNWLRPTHVTEV